MPLDKHLAAPAVPLLTPAALALVGQGVSIVVATRDADHRPQIARGWGPEVLSPSLRLCVESRAGSRALDNLLCSAPIAVTFTRPSTYHSMQGKGIVAAIEAPTDGQIRRVEDHWRAYAGEATRLGLSPRLISRLLDREALLAVTITLEEIYDQTPGPRAGVRL